MIKIIKSSLISLAIIFQLSILFQVNVDEWGYSFRTFIREHWIVTSSIIILCFLYAHSKLYDNKKKSISVQLPGVLFAIFTMIENTFVFGSGFDSIDISIVNIIFTLLLFLGYREIFVQLVSYFWVFLLKLNVPMKRNAASIFIFEKNPMLIITGILLLCWAPYYICNYPGTVTFDGYYQIDQYFGIYQMTAHFPILTTTLMGVCMQIGRFLINDNFGVFLYTSLNGIILALAFSFTFLLMKKMKTSVRFRWLTLMFYAFYTEWPSFAHCMIKDTLYTAFVVIYCAEFAYLFFFKENTKISHIFLWIISGCLVCLFRKNGIYLIALTSIYAFWRVMKEKTKCMLVVINLLCVILTNFTVNSIADFMKIPRGGVQEALSIPFQQTARYIRNHEEELSEEEIAIIDATLDYNVIKSDYNPKLADPVKGTYKQTDLSKYFGLWFKQFLKHPITYLAATVNNSYGYYCLGIGFVGIQDEYNIESNEFVNTGYFDIYFASPLRDVFGKKLESFRYFIESVPILNFFYHGALYTWLLICSVCMMIEKRNKDGIIIMLPAITTVMVCIASPVNAYHSYLLPVMATIPLILAYVLKINVSEEESLLE